MLERVRDHETTYLILMTGNFTSPRGHSPAGGRTPTGRYLMVLIEPSTFRVTDRGLGDNPPPIALETFGPVSDLTGYFDDADRRPASGHQSSQ